MSINKLHKTMQSILEATHETMGFYKLPNGSYTESSTWMLKDNYANEVHLTDLELSVVGIIVGKVESAITNADLDDLEKLTGTRDIETVKKYIAEASDLFVKAGLRERASADFHDTRSIIMQRRPPLGTPELIAQADLFAFEERKSAQNMGQALDMLSSLLSSLDA